MCHKFRLDMSSCVCRGRSSKYSFCHMDKGNPDYFVEGDLVLPHAMRQHTSWRRHCPPFPCAPEQDAWHRATLGDCTDTFLSVLLSIFYIGIALPPPPPRSSDSCASGASFSGRNFFAPLDIVGILIAPNPMRRLLVLRDVASLH